MYSFGPLPDLTLTHYGWYVWLGLMLTGLGPFLYKFQHAVYTENDDVGGYLTVGLLFLGTTGMVWIGSYAYEKPENIPYRATFQNFVNTKDKLYVSYRLDKTGNLVVKEVVQGHEYPKYIIMYKNKNAR